jgi:hypothetical protein
VLYVPTTHRGKKSYSEFAITKKAKELFQPTTFDKKMSLPE